MNKNLIVFMPSIEGGGVEKNLFLICNYLIKKISDLKVITISSKHSNNFQIKKMGSFWKKNKVFPGINFVNKRNF